MILLILSLVILVVSFYIDTLDNSITSITILVVLCFLNLFIFLLSREDNRLLKKNYIKHSNLIILGFVIVFLQIPIEYIFSKVDLNNTFFIPYPNHFYKSVIVASISFVSFLLGYTISKKRKINRIQKKEIKPHVNTYLLSIGSILSFIVYLVVTDKSYFLGGYAEHEFTAVMVYANVLFTSITYAYLIQSSINLRRKNKSLSFIKYMKSLSPIVQGTILVYSFLILLSGDRGPLISMVMFYLACFIYASQKKIKMKFIIPGLIASAILLTFIGIVRNPILNELSWTQKFEYFKEIQENKVYKSPSTIELAASFRTINAVVGEIPDNHDYLYGEFLIKNLFSTIPGISQILIKLFFDNAPNIRQTPATFITYIIQGNNPRYGDGSSCISDVYMDFGLVGVLFVFIIFGGFVRNLEVVLYEKNISPSLFLVILSISYFALGISVSRNSIFNPLIISVRIYIFLYLNFLILKTKKQNPTNS